LIQDHKQYPKDLLLLGQRLQTLSLSAQAGD
jgi:hypothetical protein